MLQNCSRIIIVGCGGAGKSFLARRLASLMGLPWICLDNHYWQPGWRQTPREEWEEIVDALVQKPAWIMDGNYSGTLERRIASADAVIFLNFSRSACLCSILNRWLRYRGRDRPDLARGCPERMTWGFFMWVWNYPSERKPLVLRAIARQGAGKEVVTLTCRSEVLDLLDSVARYRPRPTNLAQIPY